MTLATLVVMIHARKRVEEFSWLAAIEPRRGAAQATVAYCSDEEIVAGFFLRRRLTFLAFSRDAGRLASEMDISRLPSSAIQVSLPKMPAISPATLHKEK